MFSMYTILVIILIEFNIDDQNKQTSNEIILNDK